VSDLLFCPTETAVANLAAEGVTGGVVRTGDVMLEATRHFADRAAERAPLSGLTGHGAGEYAVATIHRAGNVDDPAVLGSIMDGLGRTGLPVILPLHPRTAMLTLVRHARCVLTDSGGLQKEALWLTVPCVTLRDETEWVETLQGGWNRLVGADPDRIRDAVRERPVGPPPAFGAMTQGPASVLIADALTRAT
jgi:UDP-GlcNAc3NAcA epimerase